MARNEQLARAIRKEFLQLKAKQHRLVMQKSGRELIRPVRLLGAWFDTPAVASCSVGQGVVSRFLRGPWPRLALQVFLLYRKVRK